MSIRPVIIVVGLGRCGTSLAMQMLHAGGIPCVGQRPAFEDARTITDIDQSLFNDWAGHAVKILDPHLAGVPAHIPAVAIFMQRRISEQAKSIAKFSHLVGGTPRWKSRQMALLEKGLISDMRAIRQVLEPIPTLMLQFEEVLARPHEAALQMARHIGVALDLLCMAAVVKARSPLCAPDVSMELQLVREAEEASA
jgi:hypothetical protein